MNFLRDNPYKGSSLQLVANSGLAFSFSAVRYNYDVLVSSARELHPEKVKSANEDVVAPIFMAAWEVVEYADSIRQLLKLRFPNFPPRSELLELLESCNELRNSKVHIAQKAKNISRKVEQLPLHGIVKWTHYDPSQSRGRYYDIPHVSVEPIPYVDKVEEKKTVSASFSFNVKDGIRRIPPGVSNFNLLAVSKQIDLTQLVELLQAFSDELSELLEQIVQKAREVAIDKGATLTKTEDLFDMSSKPIRWVVRATASDSD